MRLRIQEGSVWQSDDHELFAVLVADQDTVTLQMIDGDGVVVLTLDEFLADVGAGRLARYEASEKEDSEGLDADLDTDAEGDEDEAMETEDDVAEGSDDTDEDEAAEAGT